jgi:hypothetical protein
MTFVGKTKRAGVLCCVKRRARTSRSRNGSAAGHRRGRDENGCLVHHKLETLAVAAPVARPFVAKPPSAGQALEEENVMQSTDGSRPKGLLT